MKITKRSKIRTLSPLSFLRNQRGVALMMALFSMVLMMYIATEISYESNVEFLVAAQNVQRLKAYYAAKSGIDISLLRLQIYRKAMAQFGESLGDQKGMIDLIWSFPLTWPPLVPKGAGSASKSEVNDLIKESFMDASFTSTIEPEGGKIDINDLDSPIDVLKKQTRFQLLQLFQKKVEADKDFALKFRDVKMDEILSHITDWIDADSVSLVGGEESSYYRELNSQDLPPNRPFYTLDELHMVAGMTDDIYDFLSPNLTIWGSKGINLNYADDGLMQAIDPTFNDNFLKVFNERKSKIGSGHLSEEEFKEFLKQNTNASKFNDEEYPYVIDMEYNFKITSSGSFQKGSREIEAVVYDYEGIRQRLTDLLKKQEEKKKQGQDAQGGQKNPQDQTGAQGRQGAGQPEGQGQTQGQSKAKRPAPKGKPLIVYWVEK